MFDMKIHYEKVITKPLEEYARDVMENILTLRPPSETCWISQFAHIINEYDVGYYGYLWSQVFALDMFNSKFKKNPLDPKIGLEYREKILKPGSSKDAKDMLIDFLGREPNEEAFLKDMGL